jgi:hypothetical protein
MSNAGRIPDVTIGVGISTGSRKKHAAMLFDTDSDTEPD